MCNFAVIMLKYLTSSNDLIQHRQFIENLYKKCGRIYLHSYSSLEASYRQKKEKDMVTIIDLEAQIVSAFEKKTTDIWQCNFSGFPFLCGKDINKSTLELYIHQIKQYLKTNTIYFPLVYKTDSRIIDLMNVKNSSYWNRLPTPIIKNDFKESTIWERVRSRYGSRADKQKKLFERNLCTQKLTLVDLKDEITKVEISSWKRKYKQDMLSRDNQIDFYSNIIKSGLANITFAYDKTIPVAFRIDVLSHGILYVIKWSYAENYKKFSPGFYLLSVDLFRSYKNYKLKFIDLYGSPDSLKNLIENDRLDRIDICVSEEIDTVNILKNNRIGYDKKILDNYYKNQSIKNIFNRYENQKK